MRTTAAVLAAALAAFLPPPAAAEGAGEGGDDKIWKACQGDVERFCAGVEGTHACINEHWDRLSKGCRAAKEGANKAWAQGDFSKSMRKACGADVDQFCSNTPQPGICLQQHWDELSPGCRAFKESWRKRQAKDQKDPFRQACGEDLDRFCVGSEKPGMCLHEHWGELSEGCRAFKENAKREWESKNSAKREKGGHKGKDHGGKEKKGKMSFEWSDKGKQAEDAGSN